MTFILSPRRRQTHLPQLHVIQSVHSLFLWSCSLFFQAQSSVCSRLGALPGLSAEKQTGESTEEAGGAPRSAGEDLSVQDQPSASSSSPSRASSVLQPHKDQKQSHQEGRRLPALAWF